MFRMTGENKSNTESAVPIHSSLTGRPPPPPLLLTWVDCLQPPTVAVLCTDASVMQNCSHCSTAGISTQMPLALLVSLYSPILHVCTTVLEEENANKRLVNEQLRPIFSNVAAHSFFFLPLHISWQRYASLMNIYFSQTHL